MFGNKNYENEIKEMRQLMVTSIEQEKKIRQLLIDKIDILDNHVTSLTNKIILMAKIQNKHKEFILFLIKHTNLSYDDAPELKKLIEELNGVILNENK